MTAEAFIDERHLTTFTEGLTIPESTAVDQFGQGAELHLGFSVVKAQEVTCLGEAFIHYAMEKFL